MRPQDSPNAFLLPRTESKISVTLPRYRHATIFNCWICAKFSQWLGVVNDKIFEDWRREALQVEYSAIMGTAMEGSSDIPLPFVFTICPSGYHQQVCDIELNFFSAQGKLL
jgi:hypothetical protein